MLLVNHGKRCPRCAKNGKPRKASDGNCPLFGTKTVKEILKDEPDHSSEYAGTVKTDPESAHDVAVKPHPGGGSQKTVKSDPDANQDAKEKQQGNRHSAESTKATSGEDATAGVKQEADEQAAVVQTQSKSEPSQT